MLPLLPPESGLNSTNRRARRIANRERESNFSSFARQQINNTRRVLHPWSAELHSIFSRGQKEKHRGVPDKGAVNPHLCGGGHGSKQQLARILTSLFFKGATIGDLGWWA